MRRILSWALALAALLLPGCGGRGNRLVEDASPANGTLTLYRYDGETSTWAELRDEAEEEALLAALSAVEAKEAPDWTPALVITPVYSLTIIKTDGYFLEAVWSNGYWIDGDGVVYRFDCDWEKLISGRGWENERAKTSAWGMSDFRYLLQRGDTWFPERMRPAEDLEAPEGVSMALTGREGDTLTVAYTNSGAEEWCYGLYYDVQVLLDGVWYEVPILPEADWIIYDLACIVPAGESREESYDLTPYGELPAGRYRLAAEGMVVEFTVD